MSDFSHENNTKYNLKIASADVGDTLKKKRLKLAETKLDLPMKNQLPEVEDDKSYPGQD